jgi:hypothetical protein
LSFPPTINRVGLYTLVRISGGVAKSGLPPRETIAPISLGFCAAAVNAAAAPVLAPKYPILLFANCFVSSFSNNQSVTRSRRFESNLILNLFNTRPGILSCIFLMAL